MRHKHIAITGRRPGDDEDCCFVFKDMTLDESYQAFSDAVYAAAFSSDPLALEACRQDNKDQYGSSVYITHVIVSNTPMTIMV